MFTSQRVLELLARGQITTDEADELLATMRTKRSSVWHRVTHPLEQLKVQAALLLGAGAAVCGLLLGELGIRFDGALDLHVNASPVPWNARFGDLVASFPLFAVVFWLGLRTATKRVRLIDVMAAVGLARVSYIPTAGLLALIARTVPGGAVQTTLVAVVALLGLAWFVTWLCTGIQAASGLAGPRFSVAFVSLMLLAELLSKLAVHLIA